MPRRHPAIVWMAAEYARSVGAADRAATGLASTRVLVEQTRRRLERLERLAAGQKSRLEAARARAAVMADGLRLATPDSDPAAIAAVRGWKEMHGQGWMSKRLGELLRQAQPDYVSGTVLANRLAEEADISTKPDFDAIHWRRCVLWSMKRLRKKGVAESVVRQRASDNQWECCWRWKAGATLEDYRRHAHRMAAPPVPI